MNKKLGFFQSIRFKIALVFALLLLITLQIVGAYFVQQLKNDNLRSFKQQVELSTYVENSLVDSLENNNTQTANRKIKGILEDINNSNVSEIQVVDAKATIRGDSTVNSNMVGQKTTDEDVINTIYNGRATAKTTYNKNSDKRYYITVTPLFSSKGNTNTVVGAVYLRANLNSVYDSINSVTVIFATAAIIATGIGLLLAILVSAAITTPIDEMKRQTTRIARGDYSGSVHVYGNDELGQLAMAVNNLSDRVEEAQESTESERRRLYSVLTHMSDGVIATDRRGNVITLNEMAARLMAVNADEMMGKSILDVLDIRNQYTLRDLLAIEDEIQLVTSDKEGNRQVLNAYFSLIQRESGFISGLVCVLHDVTEQEKIESERRQFVSNVSHELRTPLTSMKSYLEALNDGAWQDPEIAPQFLQVTQEEADRMIRLINDLLNLSRMDSGTAKLDLETVNLNELFAYILNRFDMMIEKDNNDTRQTKTKNYTIKREFTKRTVWVEIDTDRFIQVIDNIMNNAIKYSPDGGVITCRIQETGTNVILSITDQGLGIPQKDIDHIFDRFFRVDKARSRAQGGTGLGLAISKEVIEMLHGKIWVESKLGKGSTFYISLPYIDYDEGDLWDED